MAQKRASPGTPPAEASTPDHYHWMVLSVTSIGVLLTALNLSALYVALPSVVRHFHAGALAASWILLSYMLVNTVLILVFGRIADIFGRRTLYLIGFVIFVLSSLLLGLAPNVWVLIGLRGVQAAGGALIITNTTAILTDVFPRRLLSQGLGLNVAMASISQLLGSAVGGVVVALGGWRWVFWYNVPVGIIGLLWGILVLRPMPTSGPHEPIDVRGSVLSFMALTGLLVALSEGGVQGWSTLPVLVGLTAFLVLLPIFLRVEVRTRYPIVDLSLFRNWTYASANLTTFLNSATRSSPALLIPLFLQAARGESPATVGLQVLPLSVGLLLASPVAGFLGSRYSARLLSSIGLGVSGVGLLILALGATATTPYTVIALGLLLTGSGSGFFLTPNTTSIMTSVPPERRGAANGLRSMLQNTGVVVSTALCLAIATSPLPAAFKDQAYAGTLSHLSQHAVGLFSSGVQMAFAVMALIAFFAMVVSFARGGAIRTSPRGT